MAGTLYAGAVSSMVTGGLPMNVATYKLMFVNANYTFAVTETAVTTLATHELGENGNVSGYTKGFNGAGRHAITVATSIGASTNIVKVVLSGAGLVWTALGTATGGETIAGVALIKESVNDAGSTPICFWPVTPAITTNGSDVTISAAPNGNITFTCS